MDKRFIVLLVVLLAVYFVFSGNPTGMAVGSLTWSDELRVTATILNETSPSIYISGSRSVIVWIANDSKQIYGTYYIGNSKGTAGGSNMRVYASGAREPFIYKDQLIWVSADDSNVYYGTLNTDTFSLSSIQQLSFDGNAASPSASVDEYGNVHAIWTDDRSGNHEVYYSRMLPNGTLVYNQSGVTIGADSRSASVYTFNGNISIMYADNSLYLYTLNYTLDEMSAENIDANNAMLTQRAIAYLGDKQLITWADDDGVYYKFGSDDAVKIADAGRDAAVSSDNEYAMIVWRNEDTRALRYLLLNATGVIESNSVVSAVAGSIGGIDVSLVNNRAGIVWVSNLSNDVFYKYLDIVPGQACSVVVSYANCTYVGGNLFNVSLSAVWNGYNASSYALVWGNLFNATPDRTVHSASRFLSSPLSYSYLINGTGSAFNLSLNVQVFQPITVDSSQFLCGSVPVRDWLQCYMPAYNITTYHVNRSVSEISSSLNEVASYVNNILNTSLLPSTKNNIATLSNAMQQNIETARNINSINGRSVSVLGLKYTGPATTNLMIYDTVPKSFAYSANDISIEASGADMRVVNQDPAYLFNYGSVVTNQTISISYTTNSYLSGSVLGDFHAPQVFLAPAQLFNTTTTSSTTTTILNQTTTISTSTIYTNGSSTTSSISGDGDDEGGDGGLILILIILAAGILVFVFRMKLIFFIKYLTS
ncbi:MAG: hypothetical protein ABIG30_02015 [Candidatus Aenigmatarchaeota archaeon]